MVIMAILAVLATVFALGYASGCSAHQTDDEVKTPEPVVTAETVTPPAPEQSPVEPSAPPEETTEPARHRDDIVSEGRLLSYELQEVMQDCCERYEVPYYHYEERGWITLHGLENVNAMYKEYHALGGNGTVTALVNTIHELEVRDDKRPASQA